MSSGLHVLSTKLTIPPLAGGIVARPHLMARLNEVRSLTILSTPPGFGKTTLLLAWLQQLAAITDHVPPAISWLSLDDDDNDPMRFWSYVIAALQTTAPDLGASALAALQSSPTPNMTLVITLLINDLAAQSQARVLILDDYQVIAQSVIHTSFNFLLEHLPANVRVILATRADPPWPLARWRARNQLTELRQADLRFSPAESAEFLQQLMKLPLTPDDIVALEQHTAGWVTGLQLAALAMRERTDQAAFIRSLSGAHVYITDYFVEEILNHQSETMQSFLIQTALLDQLCAGVCAAVTDRPDSQSILEQLQRANLFVLPLDHERTWYRYHPLFGEMLRARLTQTHAAEIPGLHRRAADWYEQQHFMAEAIEHVLAAGDFERAAQLIEAVAPERLLRGEAYGLLHWLQALPTSVLERRPPLQVLLAMTLMGLGEFKAAIAQLDRVDEQVLTLDERAVAAVVRSGVANFQGETQRAADFAQQGLTLVEQAQASAVAPSSYVSVVALLVASTLAGAQALRGQLTEAIDTTQRALQLAAEVHLPALWMALAGLQFAQVGQWLYEQNELKTAHSYVLQSLELSREVHNTEAEAYGLIALARVCQAQGQSEPAGQHAQRAIELIRQRDVPLEMAHVLVQATRLWLQQGNLAAVRDWAIQTVPRIAVKGDSTLTPIELAEAILLARVRLMEGRSVEVANRLTQLRSIAAATEQIDALIDILIVQATLAWTNGRSSAALETLQQALAYAEPGGYVRRFIDEGALMQAMLAKFLEVQRHGHVAPEPRVTLTYLSRLLTAFEATTTQPAAITTSTSALHPPSAPPPLRGGQGEAQRGASVEPLSDRELEILGLIAANRSNQEIAQELVLSLSTVKWHVTNL